MVSPPLSVLLVEDNLGDVRLFELALQEVWAGHYQLTHADRLGTALTLLAQAHPDVMVMDLSLPDGSGLEMVSRVRAQHPDLPIVVLTGTFDESRGLEAIRRGAQDYLAKGHVTGEMLGRVLRYAVERQHAQMALRDKLHELEQFKTLTVDREHQMITLKQELTHLYRALGRPSPYEPPPER